MSKPVDNAVEIIAQRIHRHQRFLVATHVRPDGDAVGSAVGLMLMLRKMGKTAVAFCQDPAPANYSFLPGSELIRHDFQTISAASYDAAILVDCAELERVGDDLAQAVGKVPLLINIDHHPTPEPYGDLYWVEPSASSVCEMLYELSTVLPVEVDPDIATNLYTGILTDTGSFRYSNTSARVLDSAARLAVAGARPHAIAEQVYESVPPERLSLLSRVLSTLGFHAGDRLATAQMTLRMFQETGTSPADSDGFVNHLRSVRTVDLAMLFREGEDGLIHISMRSRGAVDVSSLAQRYGGGGHRHAAACRLPGTMEDIHSRLTREASSYLASGTLPG